MAGETRAPTSAEALLAELMRRAREPFSSLVEDIGFAAAVRVYLRVARHLVEANPDEAGEIPIGGIRDPGALWLVGEDADRAREEAASRSDLRPEEGQLLIAARVFGAIAYRHPFDDANKRTAFVAAMVVGQCLGLPLRPFSAGALDSEVTDLTAREANDEEVAGWLLRKVFIVSASDGEVSR